MTQFYSRIDTEFNGDVYSIPFSYINKSEINVYINDELFTNWEFLNDSQIKLLEIPSELPENPIVSIRRITDISEKIVDYTNQSMLREENINLSQDQLLNAVQEIYDNNIQFEIDTIQTIKDNQEEIIDTLEENRQEILDIQEQFEGETNAAIKDFEDGIDAKIATVADAADRINDLDNDLAIATNAAAQATQEAQNAAQQVQNAKEQAEIAANKADEILNVKDELETEIGTKANVDLSNLSSLGQSKFDLKADKVDVLNKSQITNCITKIPQRIKYTLENGTLTILAGSVVIIPYGIEDLTSQYPIDSTFLHENFKVVDTQFVEGKFFIWAELQNDVSKTSTDADEDLVVQFRMDRSESEPTWNLSGGYIQNFASGTTPPTKYKVYYKTDINKIFATTNTNLIYTLPFMITTGAFGSVKQVFNGMGYIGSTVWVDKGVKGLIPNGRNEDGSLKNIEYTTNTILTTTIEANLSRTRNILIGATPILTLLNYVYDLQNNYVRNSSSGEIYKCFLGGTYLVSETSVISNLRINQPPRLAEADMCDGQWVAKSSTLASSVTWETDTPVATYSLKNVLPDDGYNYEVLFMGIATTGTTAKNFVTIQLSTDIITTPASMIEARTVTTASVEAQGNIVLPVGNERIVKQYSSTSNNASGTYTLTVRGYRRIGKNI
jgi:hypothetical protein